MKAAIVTVGDEILIGQIMDTNSSFIAKAIDKIGIDVVEMISISDDRGSILRTLSNFQNKVDLVVITGGLGPTKDDITKKTLCDYFEDELIVDDFVLKHVTNLIEKFYKRPISDLNKAQALIPSKCQVLFNDLGTAPGMWLVKEKTVFVSLPGVPFEMENLVREKLVPKLVAEFKRSFIMHRTILTYGVGESLLAERIENWENNLPKFIKLAYLPSIGKVRLRLSGRGKEEEELKKAIQIQIDKLLPLINDCIIGFEEDESVEKSLGRLMKQKKLTLSTAESCTGGRISAAITAIPGSSEYFKGSIVSYATEAKQDLLDVLPETIQKFSVVSKEVAEEMAIGVRKKFNTHFSIATTGNAGPDKGESEAKMGTVCIAIATPDLVFSKIFDFGHPREKVIEKSTIQSLELLYREILKNY